MHRGQLIAYGLEGRLNDKLRLWAEGRQFWYRPVTSARSCLRLLRQGGVLLVRIGRDLEKELRLVERVSVLLPSVAAVVIGDNDNPPAAALAWDLGAAWVSCPLNAVEELQEVLARLLEKPTEPRSFPAAPIDDSFRAV